MSGGAYARAREVVDPVLDRCVVDHPFIAEILGGDLSPGTYAGYLRETFHLVRQTPRYLTAAASRCADIWLQDWFIDLAVDERHHDRLCVHDLRALGVPEERYAAAVPGLGAWTMVAQNHHLAQQGDPAAILGFAAATEGLGASLGPRVAEAMRQYPFARGASSFLKVHATEDQDHIARVEQAFDRVGEDPRRFDLLVHTWTYTLEAYGRLFSDARTHPEDLVRELVGVEG